MTEADVFDYLKAMPPADAAGLVRAAQPALVACYDPARKRTAASWGAGPEPRGVIRYQGADDEVMSLTMHQVLAEMLADTIRLMFETGCKRESLNRIVVTPEGLFPGWHRVGINGRVGTAAQEPLENFQVILHLTREELEDIQRVFSAPPQRPSARPPAPQRRRGKKP